MPRRKKSPPKPKAKTKGESSRPTTLPVKQTVRGQIKYPWGGVAYAIVSIGGRSATTGRDGKYEITDIDPGTYIVSAKAPFPGYEPASQEVALPAGETKVVDLYLDFEKTVIHGCVYGADGKPLAGAILSGIMSGKDGETAVTDDKGLFKFERASPGYQFIRVSAAGYVAQSQDFAAKKGGETKLEFHLTPGSCKVYGTILDGSDRPLRAQVALSSESGVVLQRIQSDAETGHFEFAVMPGTYNVLASAPEHQSKGWRGPVSGDQEVDLKLEPSMARQRSLASDAHTPPEVRRIRSPW